MQIIGFLMRRLKYAYANYWFSHAKAQIRSKLVFVFSYVTSTPGHLLTTSLLRPKKIKDVVRTWYGLVGRGRNVVRT